MRVMPLPSARFAASGKVYVSAATPSADHGRMQRFRCRFPYRAIYGLNFGYMFANFLK